MHINVSKAFQIDSFFCKIWKTKIVDLSLECFSCHFNHPLAFPLNCFCKAGSFCQYKPSFLLSFIGTRVRSPRSEDVTAAPALVATSKCGFLWCCGLFELAQEGVLGVEAPGPLLLSTPRQIFSSLKLRDLSLWLRASHPDSRRNLFTASFLHFSIAALRVFQKVNTMFPRQGDTSGDLKPRWLSFLVPKTVCTRCWSLCSPLRPSETH